MKRFLVCIISLASCSMGFGQSNCDPNETLQISVGNSGFGAFALSASGNYQYNYFAWSWQYGDGLSDSLTNQGTIHQYVNDGLYTACVVGWYTLMGDTCTSSYCVNLVVNFGGGPVNCADISTLVGASWVDQVGNLVQFWSPFSTIASFFQPNWSRDFGDGNTSINLNDTHYYQSTGTYVSCVEAWVHINNGLDSCFIQHCDTVNVPDTLGGYVQSCGNAYASISTINSNQGIVDFQFMSSHAIGWTVAWYFGDGTTQVDTSSGLYLANVNHQYTTSGTYIVCATIAVQVLDSITNDTCLYLLADCINFNTGSVLISEAQTSSDVSVYPNPFNGPLNIDLRSHRGNVHYRLHDIRGRVILDGSVLTNGESFELHMPAELEQAMYILQLTAGDRTTVHRVVRE